MPQRLLRRAAHRSPSGPLQGGPCALARVSSLAVQASGTLTTRCSTREPPSRGTPGASMCCDPILPLRCPTGHERTDWSLVLQSVTVWPFEPACDGLAAAQPAGAGRKSPAASRSAYHGRRAARAGRAASSGPGLNKGSRNCVKSGCALLKSKVDKLERGRALGSRHGRCTAARRATRPRALACGARARRRSWCLSMKS